MALVHRARAWYAGVRLRADLWQCAVLAAGTQTNPYTLYVEYCEANGVEP